MLKNRIRVKKKIEIAKADRFCKKTPVPGTFLRRAFTRLFRLVFLLFSAGVNTLRVLINLPDTLQKLVLSNRLLR